MIIQIAAVMWSIVGYFSGSSLIFGVGAIICIALNIIQILLKQADFPPVAVVYALSVILIGPLNGVMVAGILLCTVSIVKPRIKGLHSPKADMGC